MKQVAGVLVLGIAAGACVQSVTPLYTDDTLVAEPALVGTWVGESGDVLVVTPRDSLSYRLALVDQDGDASLWVGHVTTLGARRWLDVEPEALPEQWTEEYRASFLPTHQFFVLQLTSNVLRSASLAYDSLQATLDRDPAAVAHLMIAGDLVLTADTPALREFLATFAERPGHLEEGDAMHRASPPR